MDDNQNDSYSMQNPAFISAIRLLQKDIIESEVSNIVCNVQHTDKRCVTSTIVSAKLFFC